MEEAITPYNFVPLPDRIVEGEPVPTSDRYHADRFSGWFEVKYTTVTPTYTRAARGVSPGYSAVSSTSKNSGEQASDKQPVDFFHYGDLAPVLPGTGIRGMIRSVFEILTYSKMEFVSERRLFYRTFASGQKVLRELYAGEQDQNRRTVKQGKFRKDLLVGGVLRERGGKLVLEVSTAVGGGFVVVEKNNDIQRRYDNNERYKVHAVTFNPLTEKHYALDVQQALLSNTGTAGRLIIPGWEVPRGERRWYQVIAEPASGASVEYRIPEDVYDDYLAWGDMAHGRKFSATGGRREAPRKLEAGQYAFALLNEENPEDAAVIGANMMMALRYEKSIKDVAQRDMNLSLTDMTDAVFGYVRPQKVERDQNRPSRVFFEDACTREKQPWLHNDPQQSLRVPSILSGPKPTSIQTYLVQFDADGNEFPSLRSFGRSDARDLRHWSHPDARIRGFKRYWHRSVEAAYGELQPDTDDRDLGTQKTRIRPVREQVVFAGRIRFENLTQVELGALYASVQLPNVPYDFLHKFGMGKNLGLGSLRVQIDKTVLFDFAARYGTFCPLETAEYTGQKSAEATDIDLKNAYAAFVSKLPGRPASLWSSERLRAFAILSMQSWNPDDTTRQIGIDTQEGIQWKRRFLLPEARSFFDPAEKNPSDVLPLPGREGKAKPTAPTRETEEGNSTPPAPTYTEGQKIKVRVLRKTATPMEAFVVLPHEEEFLMKNAGVCSEGEEIAVKVFKITNGKIKELKR